MISQALGFMIAVLLTANASELLAKPAVPPKIVGIGLGLFGAIYTHESGHALVAKYYGWEVESVGFAVNENGVGGVTRIKPKEDSDQARRQYALICAAGSVFQIVPVLAAPMISRHSQNIYLNSSLEYLGLFGSADFLFYTLKDQLLTWANDPHANEGDWRRFSDFSGIPLPVVLGVSVAWTWTLIHYQTRMYESFHHENDAVTTPRPAITLFNAKIFQF